VDVMGRWNIRCRVVGKRGTVCGCRRLDIRYRVVGKGLRFVNVMGRWNIRCRGQGVMVKIRC